MKSEELLKNLTEQGNTIRDELLQLEKTFNEKKEQYLRISGAIEALNAVEKDQ